MELFIYILIFIMGSFIGSFASLAVYRIPKRQDILYKHSYCPNCEHKLKLLDLIPIFSYLFLRGKCRYCKEPVRIRYLLLEVFSGLGFLLFTLSLHINFLQINVNSIIYYTFGLVYITTLVLIAGIDKEYQNIQKSILIFGFIFVFGYIVYVYTLGINIYTYVIYILVLLILLILTFYMDQTKNPYRYFIQILALILYMATFTGTHIVVFSLMLSLTLVWIHRWIKKEWSSVPLGFYLCISNIIGFVVQNAFFPIC